MKQTKKKHYSELSTLLKKTMIQKEKIEDKSNCERIKH